MRRWLAALGLGIIGGPLVLLMVVATACDAVELSPTVEPTADVAVDTTDVEVVYASRERQPPLLIPGAYEPLWGGIGADEPIIDRLLRAIEGGTPVEIEEEGTLLSNIPLVMNVRFRDGTTWSVRQVAKCILTSEGRPTNCRDVPQHWHLLHSDEVIVSSALTEWFERVHEYMPEVEYIEFPDPITPGEPFTISGAGFHEGDRVQLSIHLSDESVLALAEVPLKYGSFGWDGEVPETASTGPGKVGMQVLDDAEVVWGVTVSTTVAAPAVSGAKNPTQTLGDVEYSAADLAAWYEDVMDVVFQVPGIAWTDLDERKNRIEIGMYPRRGGREEMEAALGTVDVPREAIVIDVGCEGIRQWPLDLWESRDEAFLSAIDHSLELVSQVPYGETVEMKLTLRNVGDESVRFFLGGRPPYDFVVSTPDGEQVWHWKCAKIVEEPLDRETLGPGEELEFLGEWEQVDNRGEPVPPGSYLVHGMLNLDPPEKLVTEAHELEVQVPTTANTPSSTATPTPIPIPADSRGRPKVPPHGPGAEIGTGYPYTLYVHCGIRDAYFDGRLWMADPILSDGSGNPPVDWTTADSRGKMKLVRDDLAVFTAKSGRIVEFKPWPLDVERGPCF